MFLEGSPAVVKLGTCKCLQLTTWSCTPRLDVVQHRMQLVPGIVYGRSSWTVMVKGNHGFSSPGRDFDLLARAIRIHQKMRSGNRLLLGHHSRVEVAVMTPQISSLGENAAGSAHHRRPPLWEA